MLEPAPLKVVRVLKGAHQGPVADICVVDDGSFVSGGLSDAALVVFDDQYQLIGAGATLPERFGAVRCIRRRSFSKDKDVRFYHLLVGTTANCIVDVSFKVGGDQTDEEEFLKPTSLDLKKRSNESLDEDDYLAPRKDLVDRKPSSDTLDADDYLTPTFNKFATINARDLSPPSEAPLPIPTVSYTQFKPQNPSSTDC